MNEKDRRKFDRVSYPCAITVWRADEISEVILAHTADLGAGGLSVYLNHHVPPRITVEVAMDWPDGSKFHCKGKVLRCSHDPRVKEHKYFYKTIIEFVDLAPSQTIELHFWVERLGEEA